MKKHVVLSMPVLVLAMFVLIGAVSLHEGEKGVDAIENAIQEMECKIEWGETASVILFTHPCCDAVYEVKIEGSSPGGYTYTCETPGGARCPCCEDEAGEPGEG